MIKSSNLPLRLIILFAAVFFSTTVLAQLTANFNADKTQGCSPLVVRFTDLSSGGPTSWFWEFGNGNTSTQQNPTAFYFTPGIYHVKLVVRKIGAVDSIIKSQFITVHQSPTIAFNTLDTVGCVPFTVKYNNQSTPGSGSIVSWQWDVGDGTINTAQNPQHTYMVAGNFTITLKAVNSFGCEKTVSRPSYIRVNEGITAGFTYTGGVVCRGSAPVAFTNTSVGNGTLTYQWNFGDGNTSTLANPIHAYATTGTYAVSLVVKNSLGCTNTITNNVQVQVNTVAASFSTPANICQQQVISFQNTSTPGTTAATWDFGDGTTSTDINPTKIYSNAGTYPVRLINTNGTCSDTITRSIIVNAKPSANFTSVMPPRGCQLPVNVSFNSTAPNIASYQWTFGDSGTATIANPVHSYTAHGSYSVSLIVNGTNGCSDTSIQQDLVVIEPPIITGFTGIPYSGCVPFTNTISAIITTPDPVASYLWNFGDSTTSTLATPAHTYNVPGSYNVSLTITTLTGCTATYTLNAAVVVDEVPVPAFSASPLNACASEFIQFTNLSSNNVSTWIWEFGDGAISSEQNPLYHYGDTGYFTVKLTVFNNHCYDTISIQNYIYIKPPIASFTKALNCATPLVRYFTDASVAPTSWLWNFGDGNTATDQNPVHTYAQPGIYTVKLSVHNGNCTDEIVDTVRIAQGYSDFSTVDSLICHQTFTTFTALQPSSDIANYNWSFGDGNTSSGMQSIVTNIYTSSNTYNVSLVTTDVIGCVNTVNKVLTINVLGPSAAFTTLPGTCVNSSLTFNDNTTINPAYPLVSRVWDFGDGIVLPTASTTVNHTYTSVGNYTAKLVVTDSYGCMDSAFSNPPISITNPVSDFTFSDSIRCRNNNIDFTQTAQGLNLNYAWNFGDGGTSAVANPTYSYTNEGSYDVSLTVTDQNGCISSILKPAAIRIADPKASFLMPDTLRSCPPFVAVLYNTSINYTSLLWNFDDGSFSTIDTPSHFYNSTGVFNINLTIQGYGNCSASANKVLTIQGPVGTMTYGPLALCAPGVANFVASSSNSASYIWDFGDGNTFSTTNPSASHIYNDAGIYTPRLILLDSAGCAIPAFGVQEIVVSEVNAIIDSLPPSFCDSASINFSNSTTVQNDVISSYQWSFSNGNTATTSNSTQLFSTPGFYTARLIATSEKGCKDTTEAIIKVVNKPVINILNPSNVCINQPVNFQGQNTIPDTSVIKWRWNFGNGNTDTGQNPLAQQYATAGTYTIFAIATNSSGCTDSISINIIVHDLPQVNAGPDSTICAGQSITLQPAGAVTYQWENDPTLSCTNCTNPMANPLVQQIKYVVTGTSAMGCVASDTVAISVVQPFTVSISNTDTLCNGESVQLLASGADRYSWSPTAGLSNPTIANPIATPSTTTTYTVTGSDSRNCFTSTASVPITVYPIPVFSITNGNVSIPAGSVVRIQTTSSPDITNWQWTPGIGLSCNNCPEPTFTATRDIIYKAIASNNGGCKTEANVVVTVICNDGNIYIPNTFSPNNDGMNDVFYARGKGLFSIKSLRIFNRWGAVVFQRVNVAVNDPSSGWNGMYNNQPAPSDVYIYEAEVVCDNNQIMKLKGNISLVK